MLHLHKEGTIWCSGSDISMEFPSVYDDLEDNTCNSCWELCGSETKRDNSISMFIFGLVD